MPVGLHLAKRVVQGPLEHAVEMQLGTGSQNAWLSLPEDPQGVVVMVQESTSPEDQYEQAHFLVKALNEVRVGVLRFGIERTPAAPAFVLTTLNSAAKQVLQATHWLKEQPGMGELPLGYFGAHLQGLAVLLAAAKEPISSIRALAIQSTRTDLAEAALSTLELPLLLITESSNTAALKANQATVELLHSEKRLHVIPDSHFMEPGRVAERTAAVARNWFDYYLKTTPALPN